MSDELIVRHGSPTLAGLKTGNLFSCDCPDKEELFAALRSVNKRLVPKGVRLIPLRISSGKALLYLYRPDRLKEDFCSRDAGRILEEYGYPVSDPEKCVVRLKNRLYESGEFPHEIGLFLGYPPEDVRGFIENRAGGYKCRGFWKVYGDVDSARKKFDLYKKCTDIYCSQWAGGKSIERLTVAV